MGEQHRKDVISELTVLSIEASELTDRANALDDQGKKIEAAWARSEKEGVIERTAELLKTLEKQNMEIADSRTVWTEQAKALASRKEVLQDIMYKLQHEEDNLQDVDSWLKEGNVD